MLLSLDDFIFQLNTLPLTGYSLALEFGWVKQSPYQSRPHFQYTGVSGETLTLPGILYPHSAVTGTADSLTRIKDMGLSGESYVLASADGYIQGEFAIRSVTETHSHLTPGSGAQKIEFDIALERVDDGRTVRLPQSDDANVSQGGAA